jgi:predicted DNA-binding protein with PD1-like motif
MEMHGDHRARYAIGQTGRVIVARILPGADLVATLRAICTEHGIRAGVVLGSLGTLQSARLLTVARVPTHKSGVGYSDPLLLDGPIEFINGQGIISELEDGTIFVHFHGTITDTAMTMYAGHFDPVGNPVLSTMDVTIIETVGVKVRRELDPETDLVLNYPRSAGGG